MPAIVNPAPAVTLALIGALSTIRDDAIAEVRLHDDLPCDRLNQWGK
jgi:hypothetical protein